MNNQKFLSSITTEGRQPSRPESVDTPLLLSVPEAARLLGVGTTFGWMMVRRGQIPSIRLGRRVLVPRSALERLAGDQGFDSVE